MGIVLTLLGTAVPSLIKMAEGLIFPGSKLAEKVFADVQAGLPGVPATLGEAKKKLVMDMMAFFWDQAGSKIFPDLPNVDEKRLFLKLCDVLIEELVPQLTKG